MSSNGFTTPFPGGAGGNGISNVSYSAPKPIFTGVVTADDFQLHDGSSLVERLRVIEERLVILSNPTPENLEKFQAMKEAFDQYKFLEALLNG